MDGQASRQTDRQTDKPNTLTMASRKKTWHMQTAVRQRYTGGQTDRPTGRQAGRQAVSQSDRQTD